MKNKKNSINEKIESYARTAAAINVYEERLQNFIYALNETIKMLVSFNYAAERRRIEKWNNHPLKQWADKKTGKTQ